MREDQLDEQTLLGKKVEPVGKKPKKNKDNNDDKKDPDDEEHQSWDEWVDDEEHQSRGDWDFYFFFLLLFPAPV